MLADYSTFLSTFQIAVISVVGGHTLQECVRRILRHIMTNALAMLFNWCGKGDKQSFSLLKLNDTITSEYKFGSY